MTLDPYTPVSEGWVNPETLSPNTLLNTARNAFRRVEKEDLVVYLVAMHPITLELLFANDVADGPVVDFDPNGIGNRPRYYLWTADIVTDLYLPVGAIVPREIHDNLPVPEECLICE